MKTCPDWLPGKKFGKDRPRCRQCNKLLSPIIECRYQEQEILVESAERGILVPCAVKTEVPVRVAGYGQDGEGLFCSVECGYDFGRRAAQEVGEDKTVSPNQTALWEDG
jgi:hypothetical protein